MLNVGTGEDVTIGEVDAMVMDLGRFLGEIMFDTGKPRKLLSVEHLYALGCGHKLGCTRASLWPTGIPCWAAAVGLLRSRPAFLLGTSPARPMESKLAPT